jgi:hypothetical protein
MAFHRRFTARNALLVLLIWLFLALAFHLKDELWDKMKMPGTVESIHHPITATPEDLKRPVQENNGKKEDGGTGEGVVGIKKPDTKKPVGKRTAVVVASQKSEDPTWLDEYFPSWEKNIYRVDDSKAKLRIPKNKGRESMVYLT